jgi:hypothetical protein
MITIRASKIHLARACPPSQQPSEIRVAGDDYPAAMGTALHHLTLTGIGHGQHLEVSDVAEMFGVDPEELDRLAAQTWRAWEQVKQHFPEPKIEEFVEFYDEPSALRLTGHIDLVSILERLAFIDFKSGWSDLDHDDQMKAYAWLLLRAYKDEEYVYGMVISPRLGRGFGKMYHRKDLELWWKGLVARLRENEDIYSPGPHCMTCPRAATCDALTARLRQIRRALSLDGTGGEHRTLREVYQDVKMMEKACAVALTVIKAEVAAKGDPELALVEEERETIRVNDQAALGAIMLALDGWHGMEGVLKANKTELKRAVMAHAPYGQKGKKFEAVVEQLRDLGSVEKQIITKLEIKRGEQLSDSDRTASGQAKRITGQPSS